METPMTPANTASPRLLTSPPSTVVPAFAPRVRSGKTPAFHNDFASRAKRSIDAPLNTPLLAARLQRATPEALEALSVDSKNIQYFRHAVAEGIRQDIPLFKEQKSLNPAGMTQEQLDVQASERIANLLQTIQMKVEPNSTYAHLHKLGEAGTVSLKQFILDHGWILPSSSNEFRNLLNHLQRPTLPVQVFGDYGGTMSWPQPTHHEQLLGAYYHPAHTLEMPDGSELFGLLTSKLSLTQTDAVDPKQVIRALLESPAGREVGRVLHDKFGTVPMADGDTDWLLTALQVSLDRESVLGQQPPPRNRVAGFELADSRFWGKPPSAVVAGLTEHLKKLNRASESMAPTAAYLLLARKAPQYLVKGIPPGVVYGSHSWASLCTAVARIEAQAPGSAAAMNYGQVMAFDNVAPVTLADQMVERHAQNEAIIDWAVCHGIIPADASGQYTPEQMLRIRNAFDEEVSQLAQASAFQRADIPSRKQVALDWLKEAFGANTDYEKKCIYPEPQNKDLPGPYSVADLVIEGKLLYAPKITLPKNAFRAAVFRTVTAKWTSKDPAVPIAQIVSQAKTRTLPDFNQRFEAKANEHLDQLEVSSFDAILHMLTNLPLEDRALIEYGKVEVYREELIHHQPLSYPYWRRGQPDGQKPLLVRAEREGKIKFYEVNPNQHKIIPRPDLERDFRVGHSAFKYAYELHPKPIDDDKIKVTTYADIPQDRRYIEKVSIAPEDAQRFAERPGITDIPQTSGSNRTFRIAQLVRDNMYGQVREKLLREAKGLTTFESEVPFIRKLRQFLLNLIPLRSAIVNFSRGNIGGGIQDLFFDTLGFVIAGASAAGQAGRVINAAGSATTKAWRVGSIIGRNAIGALSPIPGVENAVARVGRSGIGSVSRAQAVINRVRGSAGHYDLLKASKHFDAAATGTYKAGEEIVEGAAVLYHGKWYPYAPASGRPYGAAIDDFTPSLRASGEHLESWQGAAPALSEQSKRIRESFKSLSQKLKDGPHSAEFSHGYMAGDPHSIKGFSARLNSEQVMKLAQTQGLAPAQVGALVRQQERLAVQHAFSGVKQAQSIIDAAGGTFTPNPQLFYLSQVDALSQGQCAALSKVMASAIEQGKAQTLVENMFSVAAHPTHPASTAFTKTLYDAQKQLGSPTVFHAGNPVRQISHHELIAELGRADTSMTLMIDSPGHAMMAGVKFEGNHKRFFFYDPNLGIASFPTQEAMERGLQALFTQKKPAVPYRTYSNNPDRLEFKVSRHDEGWTSKASIQDTSIKQLYEKPIDTSVTNSGQQVTKTIAVEPARIYVPVTEAAHSQDAHSVLYTRGISDCTALAVLTDLKDGIYHKRTLIHLQGGVADPQMLPLLKQLHASLADGGKVIFIGGDSARSAQGLASSLKQTLGDSQPLLDIINRQPQSTLLVTASGIDLKPDGTFDLIEGLHPTQVLDAAAKKQVYDRID